MIYLTKEDWSNYLLPKLRDDRLFIEEFQKLNKIFNGLNFLCQEIYFQRKNRQMVFSVSLIFFYKYYLKTSLNLSTITPDQVYSIFGACISLSQKSTNILEGKSLKMISDCITERMNRKYPKNPMNKEKLLEDIKIKEYQILDSIGYDINYNSPYEFYPKSLEYIKKINLNVETVNDSLNYYVFNSFRLPLSIYYSPNVICISCIQLLKEHFELNSINIVDLINLSEYPIDNDELNECILILRKIEDRIAIMKKKRI